MTTPVIRSRKLVGGGGPTPVPDDVLVWIDINDPNYPNYIITLSTVLVNDADEILFGRTL